MKVIDILNKIANGEQPPKRIYYKGNTYIYNKEEKDYESEVFVEYLFDSHIITDILNDEVEILEATITYKQDDKIGKLNIALFDDDDLTTNNKLKHIAFRVNEIIEKVNNYENK